MIRKQIPAEALINLRQRLDILPSRCRERSLLVEETAVLYGVSTDTVYRVLRQYSRPKPINRSDSGSPRKLSSTEMELYCEVIAAMKIRTCNKKGRHVSTTRAIELLEDSGMNTPYGFIQPAKGLLNKTTVNRYLKTWGYDHLTMTRQPPAVSFQADYSNQCWHFDLSPSDLKHVKQPLWVEPGRGNPLLMLEGKILVSKSLSVDKDRTTLPTLISALFYDLSADKEIKIPKVGEKRERELRDLVKKGKKPVALFVDEAHDLHYSTLTGLKRLMEVVEDGGGTLSVVLAGHPKLKNDLRRPTMEEIGYRSTVFSLDGIVGSQREYIEWLVSKCTTELTQISDILEAEAIDLLAMRLRTPLQIEQHLTLVQHGVNKPSIRQLKLYPYMSTEKV